MYQGRKYQLKDKKFKLIVGLIFVKITLQFTLTCIDFIKYTFIHIAMCISNTTKLNKFKINRNNGWPPPSISLFKGAKESEMQIHL